MRAGVGPGLPARSGTHVDPLPNSTEATGDVLGALQLDLTLNPDETYKLCFAAGVYAHVTPACEP